MTFIELKLKCRLIELEPLIQQVLDAYKKHQADFNNYLSMYNILYLQDIQQERIIVDAIINPVQLIQEIKDITNRIYINQNLVNDSLNLLESFTKISIGLLTPSQGFGVGGVRRANSSIDIVSVVKNIKNVILNIDKNMIALLAVGYTVADKKAFAALAVSLENDYILQTEKLAEYKKLVTNNYPAINSLWDKIMDICDTGKKIYNDKQNESRQQFEVSIIIINLRKKATLSLLTGIVEPKAKIELKPLMGGRKKYVYANKTGYYEMRGLSVGDYHATKSVKGNPSVIKNVTINLGVNLVEKFE